MSPKKIRFTFPCRIHKFVQKKKLKNSGKCGPAVCTRFEKTSKSMFEISKLLGLGMDSSFGYNFHPKNHGLNLMIYVIACFTKCSTGYEISLSSTYMTKSMLILRSFFTIMV
jgi:hypothetical protein